MSAKSAVLAAASRYPVIALNATSGYAFVRYNKPLYFGDAGEIDFHYDNTRNVMVAEAEGLPIEIRNLNMAKDRIYLENRFAQAPKVTADAVSSTGTTAAPANKDYEVAGTNAASTDTALDANGGVAISTHGASADYSVVQPQQTAGLSILKTMTFLTQKKPRFVAALQTGANITAVTIWAGFKLTNIDTKATDADQAFFRYQDTINGGKLEAVYSIASVLTSVDCSVLLGALATIAVSTQYLLAIDIDANRIARFYVNGILAATSTALTSGAAFVPFAGIKAGAAAVKTFKLYHLSVSRDAA
jgi:hypothetical protein